MPRRRRLAGAAVSLALPALVVTGLTVSGTAGASNGSYEGQHYEIGLFGDMPYGPTGRAQFPAVIADMNAHPLAFSLFDGDIKNGSERCDQGVYDAAKANFAQFRAPVVYTPGDNEWTDCDRASNGSYDPSERLALIRRMFFGSDMTQGAHPATVVQQSADFPENATFRVGPVTYGTVNIPGSDNNAPQFDANGTQVDGDLTEYTARNAADLAWLDTIFANATRAHSAAVVIDIQADMWDSTAVTTHFADVKKKLADLTIAFAKAGGRKVYLVNGDSHSFEVDKPLTDAQGNVIEPFTRVTTFGSAQNHWVSATVDAGDPEVLTFHQHVIAANEPAYVAP